MSRSKQPARPGSQRGAKPAADTSTLPGPGSAEALCLAADELSRQLRRLRPTAPVSFIYHPLDYAREAHHQYLRRFGRGPKKVLFLGMNPGPFGMGQTGVPFGEVAAVTAWLGIRSGVTPPGDQHPKRPIEGFDCRRSEVSGRRLWSLFRDHQPDPDRFFADHFVANYCPLLFLNERGANVTPDKLPRQARDLLEHACDRHLATLVHLLQPDHLVGVGEFARRCAERVIASTRGAATTPAIHGIIHPSPASPVANREWPARPVRQLQDAGIWP